jgi:4-hydroxy-tetrahydrodipicolinate synthase
MEFGRLITAMATPLLPDESVDLAGAQRLARHLVETGSTGIVVSGTTGESPTLTTEEKLALLSAVREAVGGRAAVIAGTGNYCTRESVELTRQAERRGADGVMLVVPYYNNPPQEGLYRHFLTVAAATSLPVMLYNVPSRAPRNLDAATTLRLAEAPNIVAIKEASGNLEQITEILARCPDGFRVYSGDDSATLPLMGLGGYGVVSVAAHLAGRQIRDMIDLMAEGQVAEAARLNGRLLPLFRACFCRPNPIPLKAGLELLGLPGGGVRLPLVAADDECRERMRRTMAELGLLA